MRKWFVPMVITISASSCSEGPLHNLGRITGTGGDSAPGGVAAETGGRPGGAGTTGGASGGGVAGSGGVGTCPAELPSLGASCGPEGLSCHYTGCSGTATYCSATAACASGRWDIGYTDCICPETGGTSSVGGASAVGGAPNGTGGVTAVGGGGSGGAGGVCGSGCTQESPTYPTCAAPTISLVCWGPFIPDLAAIMTANGCTDAATGAVRYCCPPDILTQCA